MSSATAPRPPNVGNPFVLGGTVTNGSGSLQTINTPFTMTAVRTFTGGTDIALAGNIGGSGGGISKSGSNTLILSGTNNYTGQTTVGPGVIRLDSANAVPGGIADTGGISNINLNGGVLGLAAGNFTRNLGNSVSTVQLGGNGGWAAYGGDRFVNLGGLGASVNWTTATTGLNSKILILSHPTADATVDFQNPLDMLAVARTVQVNNGSAAIDGKLSGNITGIALGNLSKTGFGTLQLTGTNNYVGTTTVSAGTLLVNGTNSGAGAVSVSSGASLGGLGTITGAVTVAAGGRINLQNGAVGNLTLGSTLTLSGTAAAPNNLRFDLGGAVATTDRIVTTGAVTAAGAGGVLVNFNQLAGGPVTPGTGIILIQAGAASTYANYALATTLSGGNVYSNLTTSGNNLVVDIATAVAGPAAAFWAGGANPWTTVANWNTDEVNSVALGSIPGVGTNVTFATTTPVAANLATNTVDADFEINSLTFNDLAGGVTIAGTKMLTLDATTANGNVDGNGITSSNTSGINTISSKIGLGGNQTWTTNGGALTVSGVVSDFGSGYALAKAGAGTLTLTGINTFTGLLTVSGGTLAIGGAGQLNGGAYGSNIVNNSTLSFTSTLDGPITLDATSTISVTGNLTVTGNITGVGGLTKTGSAFIAINGTKNDYTGPTTIGVNGGGLTFKSSLYDNDDTKWIPDNITVNSGGALVLNVGGAGEFTIAQAGTMFSQLGGVVNNNGLRAGSRFGVDTRTAGGTFAIPDDLIDSSGPGGGAVGFLYVGNGTLGSSTLELTGDNTYSGPTTVDRSGTIKVSSLNSVNGGSPPLATSSLGRPTSVANGTIQLGSNVSFVGGSLTYTGSGETTDRVINLGGANGTSYRFDQSGTGLLKFTSTFTITDNRGVKTIILQGSTAGTGEIASALPLGQSTAPNALTKSGTGTWTLSGANLYTGLTTVSGGALVLAHPTALAGGIGTTGGLSAVTFSGGVIGLGAGDFTRPLAAAGTVTAATFTGAGGWSAYGADRAVNLGGASGSITWATAGTGLNSQLLILGNPTATHTLDFQNPLDLGTAARTVQVDDGAAAIDGRLSGNITGASGGNLTKSGPGKLALSGTNNFAGTTTVSAGTLLVNGAKTGTGLVTVNSGATLGGTGSIAGAATFSTGARAEFTVTRDPLTQANTTPLTIAGVMTFNATEVRLNLPANLPSGTYTLATSSATPTGTVTATPVVLGGSYAAGFTSAVVSLDTAGKKLLLTVNGLPTSPTQLAITTVNSGSSPVATAGFSVVVQAQDANGASRLASANTDVSLSLNAGSGPLGGTLIGTIPAGSTSVTISGVTYGTAESGVVLTATRTGGDLLTAGDSAPFTVLPVTTPTSLTVTGFPSPQASGAPGTVTVTAKTAVGLTATNYVGTVAFASSSVSAGLPSNYAFVSGDNGVRVFTGVTLNTVGTQSITVTDTVTPSITGTQSGITITSATAAALVVSGYPSPRAAGLAGSVTVTAKDAFNNTVPNYVGTIQFSSTDGSASLPANYTFTAGDNGVRTFTNGVTMNTVGVQSITATDTVTSITGTQSAITVWVPPTSFTWRSATNGNWNDATKWAQSSGIDYGPLTAGQANYVLNFIAGSYTATHNLSSGFLVNQLNFAGAATLDGTNSLALSSNGAALPQINQNSSNGVSINPPLSLAANLTVGGSGNGNVALSGAISGAGSLTKSNTGTLTLNGTGTYGGGTIVTTGTLQLGTTANNLLGAGLATINSGATLGLNGNSNLTTSFAFNNATVTNGNSFAANLNGPLALTGTTSIDLGTTGNMRIGGSISGAGNLVKKGSGQGPLILSGASTFTGTVSVQGGSISVGSFNSVSGGTATSNLGAPTDAASGTISLGLTSTSTTLDYSGFGETTDRVIRLAGTTGGAILSQSGTPASLAATRGTSGLLKFTSDLSIPGTAGVDNRKTLTLTHVASAATGANPGNGEISGSIGDSLTGTTGQRATSLTKTGPGTWTLSGINTYSGATKVQVGTLAIARPEALGGGTLDITSGAKVRLDFIGTRTISALSYNAGSPLPAGTYGSSASIASNKDDTRFSGPGTLTIGVASPPSTTTLARTSGTEPSNGGVTITFTATVAGSTPTGTVSFFDGLTLIGTGALDGSFQASLTTTTLGSGTHAITAQYGGNAGNAPSASAPLTQTVVETRVATATTLTSGTNPSNKWRPVTFTATVSGGASTGSVIFSDGATALGTVALNGSGQASITTTSLPVGWRPVSARYLGNATHAPSATATPLFQTVNPAPGNGKLKVFILAGQSNMQGKALVETGRDPNNLTVTGVAGGLGSLRNMLNRNPAKYGFLPNPANPIPGGSPGWITRSDVGVTYWSDPGSGENRRGNLDPYFGNNGEGPTAGNGRIGPEYAFGLEVGSQLGDKVLLIKYAFGGKSLAVDFRPPGAVAARGGVVGPYYTGMVARVNQVLANPSTYYPAYTGGGYEITGFAWHQGWNDRSNGAYTAEYEANMANLILDLRTQFSVPNLPVVIGNTGMANAPTGPGSLIEAQGNVADPTKHPELAGNVTTVNTIPFDYGVLLGEVDEGYHWNWNAESYYNIGESMAKAMMALLPPDSSTPYGAWALDPAQGLTAGINDDPTDDPDFDGIENQLEFVLGGAPVSSSQTPLPTLTKSTGSWVFSYDRSVASRPPGTTQIVEYGNNLTGWTQLTIPANTSGSVTITPLGQMDHVEVALPALGTTGFVRLKVAQ